MFTTCHTYVNSHSGLLVLFVLPPYRTYGSIYQLLKNKINLYIHLLARLLLIAKTQYKDKKPSKKSFYQKANQ